MREFTARGDKTTAILGARSKELLILADELRPLCHNVEVCTDDGSAGFKGFVTQRLAQLIAGDGPMKVMSCSSKISAKRAFSARNP